MSGMKIKLSDESRAVMLAARWQSLAGELRRASRAALRAARRSEKVPLVKHLEEVAERAGEVSEVARALASVCRRLNP